MEEFHGDDAVAANECGRMEVSKGGVDEERDALLKACKEFPGLLQVFLVAAGRASEVRHKTEGTVRAPPPIVAFDIDGAVFGEERMVVQVPASVAEEGILRKNPVEPLEVVLGGRVFAHFRNVDDCAVDGH